MKFNRTKCQVVALGTNTENGCCKLGARGPRLEMTWEEKDVGVFVDCRTTMSHQWDAAGKEAEAILGWVR